VSQEIAGKITLIFPEYFRGKIQDIIGRQFHNTSHYITIEFRNFYFFGKRYNNPSVNGE